MISILDKFQDIIHSIEIMEWIKEEEISRLKIKLLLIDSSYIFIREVKSKSSDLYSYYWLREDNTVIIGWDNAPHHKDGNPQSTFLCALCGTTKTSTTKPFT